MTPFLLTFPLCIAQSDVDVSLSPSASLAIQTEFFLLYMCVRLFGCHAFVLQHYQYISLCKCVHIDVLSLKYHVPEPAFYPFYHSLSLSFSLSLLITPFVSPQQSRRQFFLFASHSLHCFSMCRCVCCFALCLSGFFHSIPQIILDTFFESHWDWTHFCCCYILF